MKLFSLSGTNKYNFRRHLTKTAMILGVGLLLQSSFTNSSFASASANIVMKIGLTVVAGKTPQATQRFNSDAHFTWGAAEVSVVKAGYVIKQRIGNSDAKYWFIAANAAQILRIGVSQNSGEIVNIVE